MNPRTAVSIGLSICVAACLSACSGPSVWEQTFVRAPDGSGMPLVHSVPVRVRSIPWDRMQATLADLERDASAGDVHPEDWSAAQKQAAKSKLFRGLQYGGDAGSAQILGRSEFRTTETIRPDSTDREALEAFARKVGATDVIWSSKILGKTEKIEDRAVTSTTSGNFWGGHRDRNRWWDDNYTQHQTTWTPIRVPADDTGFVAYFIRGR